MSTKLKKKELKAKKEKDYIVIEFPQENELINNSSYAIRIKASNASFVIVSIDDGEWVACYNSVGYWWYDWSGYTPGDHKIIARICNEDGCIIQESNTRNCLYKI
jgi:hypothetical protein